MQISSKLTNQPSSIVPPEQMPVGDITHEEKDNEIPLETSNKRIYYAGMFFLLVVCALTIGLYILKGRVKPLEEGEPAVVEEEIVSEALPEAVQEVEEVREEGSAVQLKRSEIRLSILNGTGISGEAGRVAEQFEKLGYVDIKTGNSPSVEGHKLYINSSVSGLFEVLLEDVKEILDIKESAGELTDTSIDAQIILGE